MQAHRVPGSRPSPLSDQSAAADSRQRGHRGDMLAAPAARRRAGLRQKPGLKGRPGDGRAGLHSLRDRKHVRPRRRAAAASLQASEQAQSMPRALARRSRRAHHVRTRSSRDPAAAPRRRRVRRDPSSCPATEPDRQGAHAGNAETMILPMAAPPTASPAPGASAVHAGPAAAPRLFALAATLPGMCPERLW